MPSIQGVPSFFMLAFALLAIKFLAPHPLKLAHNANDALHNCTLSSDLSISPCLANVTSLAYANRTFARLFSSNSRPNSTLALMTLVLCGDVEANPGPITHPCMGCNMPVAVTHRAMGCDQCDRWVHIKCGNISVKDYNLFKAGNDPYIWKCPLCDLPDAPADTSSSSNDSDCSNQSGRSDSSSSNNNHSRFDRVKVVVANLGSVFSKGKGAALKAFIATTGADIVIGSETELTKDRVDSDFLPPKYLAIRLDKGKDRRGVFIAHREDLVITEVNVPDKSAEFVLAKLEVSGNPDLYIASFYRHTNADKKSLNTLYDNISQIHGGKKLPNIIVAGDFNLPDVDWEYCSYNTAPQYGKEVNELAIDVMTELSLTQMVKESTRGNNTLDLLFTSDPNIVDNVTVIPGISDHQAVTADIHIRAKRSKKKARKVYQYDKADKKKLRQDIVQLGKDFAKQSKNLNADESWNLFTSRLNSIVAERVPQKIIRERGDLPWLSPGLRKRIKRKNRSFSKYKKAPRKRKPRLWDKYSKEQRAVQQEIKLAHEEYLESLFEDEEGNPVKSFYKAIKAKKKNDVGIAPLKNKYGKIESTPIGKATALSEQYSSVFKKDNGKPLPRMNSNRYSSMKKLIITQKGIKIQLDKLNPKKAIGPDQVPTYLIKEHSDIFSSVLQIIFQKSLDTGVVPTDWKRANVVAIYKKDSKNDPANYRPVSLTCISCKVMEHIVFSNVMDHMDRHAILKHFQHGFRKQHSCETQLINTLEELCKGLKDEQQIDALILDFSKAFDVVGHRRLLGKLDHYGVRGDTHQWIESWLTGRIQRVVVEGESSEDVPVRSGVPQGTVLGPLMFIIYINDIADGTDSSIRLFADDALLYRVVSSTRDCSKLQYDLHTMCRWGSDWQMDFNPKKCHVLSITKKRNPICYPYTLNGVQLSHVENHPYLGVELDCKLSWKKHINNTTGKAQRTLNLLRRNLHGCSQKTKDIAYKTMVRPTLEYASASWDPYEQRQINQLEAVQNRAARFVKNEHRRQNVSVTGLKDSLDWRSLQERRFIARQTLFYKARHSLAAVDIPPYVGRPAPPNPDNREKRTSHDLQYKITGHSRVDTYKYSYFPRTITAWNILNEYVVNALNEKKQPCAETFKRRLIQEFATGSMWMVDPRGKLNRPRLDSTRSAGPVGPVY